MRTVKASLVEKGDVLLAKNRKQQIGTVYAVEANGTMVTMRYKTKRGDYSAIILPKNNPVPIERD
jgi:RecB family endonuclease NucS